MTTPIDVWDRTMFDPALTDVLDAESRLIADYFHTGRRVRLEREEQTVRGPMLANPLGDPFYALLDRLDALMRTRTIRGLASYTHVRRRARNGADGRVASDRHRGTSRQA